jgi:hypothetical protein
MSFYTREVFLRDVLFPARSPPSGSLAEEHLVGRFLGGLFPSLEAQRWTDVLPSAEKEVVASAR